MLVIVGLFVWLVAGIVAIAGEPSNAGAAHPLIETLRVRLSHDGVDRHVVPLWELGQRGGAAAAEFIRPADPDTPICCATPRATRTQRNLNHAQPT